MNKVPFKNNTPFKTDDLLIDSLKNGDFRSFETLYNIYVREMYILSIGYTNDSDEAKDIVQDAFVYIWNNRLSIRADSNLRNYLRTIIRNSSLNLIRNRRNRERHKKIIETETHDNLTSPNPESNLDHKEKNQEIELKLKYINKKLRQLPEGCKKAFILSVIEGHSYKQVADILGISVNTVKTQIKIAYRKIRMR